MPSPFQSRPCPLRQPWRCDKTVQAARLHDSEVLTKNRDQPVTVALHVLGDLHSSSEEVLHSDALDATLPVTRESIPYWLPSGMHTRALIGPYPYSMEQCLLPASPLAEEFSNLPHFV